jgi:hypothetical protein
VVRVAIYGGDKVLWEGRKGCGSVVERQWVFVSRLGRYCLIWKCQYVVAAVVDFFK